MDARLTYLDLPEDFVPFEDLKEEFPDLKISDWKKFASGLDIPILRFRVEVRRSYGSRVVRGINWSDVKRIRDAYAIPKANDEIISAHKLAKQFKMRKSTLLDFANLNGIGYWIYLFPNNSKGEGFKKSDAELLREIVISSRGDEIESRIRNGLVQLAPKNVKSIKRHARPRKMTERILLELCEGAGVVPKEYRVRGVSTLCLSDEQIVQLERAFSPDLMAQIVPVSIRKYAQQNRIKTSDAIDLARSAGVEPKTYLFGSRKNLGLTPDEVEIIEETYRGFPKAPFASAEEKPLGAIAKEQKIDLRTMRKLLAGTDIEVGLYRFPNGKDLRGLNRLQVNQLKQAYEPLRTLGK